MSDMSESKHKELLKEGLSALLKHRQDVKQQAILDRFSGAEGKRGASRRGLSDVQQAPNPYAEERALQKQQSFMDRVTGKKFKMESRSIAAFLFLPQFHMTFRHAAHIYPVFMRGLASMLVQAGLLPENHVALRYGEKGVDKVRFRDVMGDTWFRLRTMSGATYRQYGMFSLVVLMLVTLTATMATFFTRMFLGIGTASAQLFFTHPGNPYGAGVGVTDITGAVTGIGAPPGGSLFDSRIQGAGISVDYGLMVLDKILRQAAADTPNGGAMQNALASMMGTYNNGVTTVACVVLLWMITTIVIDTAKAGVLGGGRHNMVWAPIRVMFAAMLLIPLGTGFSAGQYGVMKLAEWGSNFGTRAWGEYVTGVLNTTNLLAPFANDNAVSLVNGVTKVITCQVVYNTHLRQNQGSLPAGHRIVAKQDNSPNKHLITNRYTNRTGSNICGTINYGSSVPMDDIDVILGLTPGSSARMTGSTPIVAAAANYNPTSTTAGGDFKTAAAAFRKAMRGALEVTMADTAGGALGSGGAAIEMARRFACRFATHRFSDGGVATHPVSQIPNCAGNPALTANVANYPDFSEQRAMHDEILNSIMNQYTTVAKPILDNYINNFMKPNMISRGWAGMGIWVQEISAMNALIAAVKAPIASIEPGTGWVPDGNAILGMNWLRCGLNFITLRPCRISGIEEKTLETLESFDGWWEEVGNDPVQNPRSLTATASNRDMKMESGGKMSQMLEWIYNMSAGDNGLITVMGRFLFPQSDSVFLFRAVDVAATGTYPLSQMTDVGHSVLGFGVFLWGTVSLIQTVSSLKGFGFSLGMGVAVGAVTNLFAAIGSSMIMAGLIMSFYLPVLPLIRVAFSTLTWMIAVFEAVVMVPIAALGHLISTGDGLTAGNSQLRTAWMLWLNVLLRPVLTVMGFVGGLLIYNAFAVYFHTSFNQGAVSVMADQNFVTNLFTKCAYSVIYLATLYTSANMCFKLMDVFPEHMMRWLGGSPDQTFRDIINKSDNSEVYMTKTAQVVNDMSDQVKAYGRGKAADIDNRADRLKDPSAIKTEQQQRQYAKDKKETENRMSKDDRAHYDSLSGDAKDKFLSQSFMHQNAGRQAAFSAGLGGGGMTFGGRMGINNTGEGKDGIKNTANLIDKNFT